MDLYNLPPLDVQTVVLSQDQQPTPRTLMGVAAVAVLGLLLSWFTSGGLPEMNPDSMQVASNVTATK